MHLVTFLGGRINDCDVSRIPPSHQKEKEFLQEYRRRVMNGGRSLFSIFSAGVYGLFGKGIRNSNHKSTRVEKEKRNSRMLSRCSARTEPSHLFLSKGNKGNAAERKQEHPVPLGIHSPFPVVHSRAWLADTEEFFCCSNNPQHDLCQQHFRRHKLMPHNENKNFHSPFPVHCWPKPKNFSVVLTTHNMTSASNISTTQSIRRF
ncbi:hypothetical protein CDAR_387581 [Caerostris darwini]|uniref:Uncharacterized protein n=1 Tax=Caerostris darwini TaxID=1538125 RepID=A0AAV4TPD6_9ARAC|nr:hypothetical protein CDAR_387581 [Caerostris darwini]